MAEKMKFRCDGCVLDGIADYPCTLTIKGTDKIERENWMYSMRRCPFEDDTSGIFNGNVPLAIWYRIK